MTKLFSQILLVSMSLVLLFDLGLAIYTIRAKYKSIKGWFSFRIMGMLFILLSIALGFLWFPEFEWMEEFEGVPLSCVLTLACLVPPAFLLHIIRVRKHSHRKYLEVSLLAVLSSISLTMIRWACPL